MGTIPPLPTDLLFYSFISGVLVSALSWLFKFIGRRAEKRFDVMVNNVDSLATSVGELTAIVKVHEYRLGDYEKRIERAEAKLLKE